MPRSVALVIALTLIDPSILASQAPAVPNTVETPSVKVLTGLTVSQFEQEMQHFVQAMGGSCNSCHMPKGNFASDENPRKVKAREMIGMTRRSTNSFSRITNRPKGNQRSAASRALRVIRGT